MLKRLEADLSQEEVAIQMGVSNKTLHAWEYDEKRPTDTQLEQLSDILSLIDLLPKWRDQH